jgi:uncharacterized protein (TIGR02145 family)
MKTFGRMAMLSAVLVVGAVCVSYGDNPLAIVGQWVNVKNGENIELFKDGTGVIGNKGLSWKTEGRRFVLQYKDNTTFVSNYNLSGYELTLTYDNGDVIVWVRKDNVKDYENKRFEKISSYFTDSRDGQVYRAVNVGGQTWMAQNLNYRIGKSACNNANNSNCEKYGRLYDWNTAKAACPIGWHLPSLQEWNDLKTAAGDYGANALKSAMGGWNNESGIKNSYGFSALPGGYGNSDGSFDGIGTSGYWWADIEGGSVGTQVYMNAGWRGVGVIIGSMDFDGFGDGSYSVRCVHGTVAYESIKEQFKNGTGANIEKIPGYFTDSRNGQRYRAVKVRDKTWMAHNLNYQTGNSWCYGNDNSNCDKYGRLYDWNTAKTACPTGWHLSSRQEWNGLVAAAGGKIAGVALKSTYGWENNGGGNYDYGFRALPGSGRGTDGSFDAIGKYGFWWTATESAISDLVYFRAMKYSEDGVVELNSGKGFGFSVRCVKNSATEDSLQLLSEVATKMSAPIKNTPMAKIWATTKDTPIEFVVNIAGMSDRFLKATVIFEYDEKNTILGEELRKRAPTKYKDMLIKHMSSLSFTEITDPSERNKICNDLQRMVNASLPKGMGEIHNVMFTNYITQ